MTFDRSDAADELLKPAPRTAEREAYEEVDLTGFGPAEKGIYVCNKCGYSGRAQRHAGCPYLAADPPAPERDRPCPRCKRPLEYSDVDEKWACNSCEEFEEFMPAPKPEHCGCRANYQRWDTYATIDRSACRYVEATVLCEVCGKKIENGCVCVFPPLTPEIEAEIAERLRKAIRNAEAAHTDRGVQALQEPNPALPEDAPASASSETPQEAARCQVCHAVVVKGRTTLHSAPAHAAYVRGLRDARAIVCIYYDEYQCRTLHCPCLRIVARIDRAEEDALIARAEEGK